ncbi:hypothetical protein ACVXHA_15350 [Escherichia coli]
MKSLRLMLCAMPLMLTGRSTMSSVNSCSANPWNWFAGRPRQSERAGRSCELTASTPLQQALPMRLMAIIACAAE